MKQKLANRSDRQAAYGRKTRSGNRGRRAIGRGGMPITGYGPKAQDPKEAEARVKTQQAKAIARAQAHGFELVKDKVAVLFHQYAYDFDASRGITGFQNVMMDLPPFTELVPASCASMLKLWEDAQKGEGEGALVPEFKRLSLASVVWLAVEEWKAKGEGR